MFDNAHFYVIDKENVGLADRFSVNPASCANSEFYRTYLQFSALSDLYTGKDTTHLFIDEDTKRIMGFVSLRASAIISHGEGEKMTGIPALEVSVLAVDKDYEGRGVGSTLIDYVLSQADELHKQYMGIQYIVLAADKKAVGFYEKMGFVPIEKRWNRIPKEGWTGDCVPMSLGLDFERNYIVSYAEDNDEDE